MKPTCLPTLQLLMLSPARMASTQILDAIFSGLANRGAIQYHSLYDNEASLAERSRAITAADIIFLLRAYTPEAVALVRLAHQLGKLVIVSTDDDFLSLAPESPLGRVHHSPENHAAYITLFQEADLVWVFTPEMHRRYARFNPHCVVGRLPSFIEWHPPSQQEPAQQELAQQESGTDQNRACIIGYAGAAHHSDNLRLLIRPLRQILDAYSHVRAEFISYVPEELAGHPHVTKRPFFADLQAYHQFLYTAGWSIGLAPLADTPFNRGKTNNKYREYAGLGIPGMYSEQPVYTSCVRHRETGYLAPHSEAGFAEALQTMVEHPNLRTRIRNRALQDAASTYAMTGVQLHVLQEISRLAIRKQYRAWRKPRLLIVGFDHAVSTHIDALQPSRQLAQQDLLEFSWLEPPTVQEQDLDRVDGVYVVRAFQPETVHLLDWAYERQLPLISAWDDDFFSLPSDTQLGEYYTHPSVLAAVRQFLQESSLVVASTPPLVHHSQQFSQAVLENRYGLDTRGLAQASNCHQPASCVEGQIRIGFYGCNAAIDEPWLVEALARLRRRYGSRLHLETLGFLPPDRPHIRHLIDWSDDTLRPYAESLWLLHSRRWDIGLAPLADTPFNAAKQATKFRDYAWAGIAVVCSRTPTYQRELLPGIHCLFADNTAVSWEQALVSLIEDANRRDFLRYGARRLLNTGHVQDLTNATWHYLVWKIGAQAALQSSASSAPSVLTAPGQEHVESLGQPPLTAEPLIGTRRYRLTPQHARWKAIQISVWAERASPASLNTSWAGSLSFRLCLANGQEIRTGQVTDALQHTTDQEADWVRIDFPEIFHSADQSFILELSYQNPHHGPHHGPRHGPHHPVVGLFETQHPRARTARIARRLGIRGVSRHLFAQLIYSL